MTHGRASRLLSGLLDGTLPPGTRRPLRAHVRGCRFCRRRLREHEAAEALVRLLPVSLLPREPSPAAQVRLWGLARWFVDPMARARERLGLSAVGLGVAVLATALSLSSGAWAPLHGPGGGVLLAQAAPDAAAMLPLGWR